MRLTEYSNSIRFSQAKLYQFCLDNLYDGEMELKDVIATWIRTARSSAGMSGADLGAQLSLELGGVRGHSKANISHWETGKHSPNLQQLLAISKITRVDLPDAIRGPMTTKSASSPLLDELAFDKNVVSAKLGARAIPVISAIQAGALREITVPYSVGDGYATIFVDGDYSQWAFGLEIEGNSMLPDFQPGDIVIIEPDWEPRPGECVAAKNGREEATFKKYRQRGSDSAGNDIFELVPLNDDYPILRSDEVQLAVIGVMAEHRRKTRRR